LTRVRSAVHGDQRRRRLPLGTLPLAVVMAVDLAVIVWLAVRPDRRGRGPAVRNDEAQVSAAVLSQTDTPASLPRPS